MITHVCLEFLGAGQLPYYDLPGPMPWFMFDEDQRWQPRGVVASHRMLIPSNIDTTVEEAEPQLREWLGALDDVTTDDGTLFFPVQTCAAMPDDAGTLLVAGGAFIPNQEMAVALEGADPVDLILQACREIRFGEVMPANLAADYHPVLQAAWRQATWPGNEQRPGVDFEQEFRRRGPSEAEIRSKALLSELLNGEQRAEFEAQTQFHVQGGDGHTYLVRKGHGHNVYRIENGLRTVIYCLVTQGHVPVYDLMLTQKLLLETDPDQFMQVANSHSLDTNDIRNRLRQRDRLREQMADLVGNLDLAPERALPARPVPGGFVVEPLLVVEEEDGAGGP